MKNLKDNLLTDQQIEVIKQMIMGSMRNVYTDMGSLPGDGFENAAGLIADKILKNAQMILLQIETLKPIEKKNKPTKKTKKHVR